MASRDSHQFPRADSSAAVYQRRRRAAGAALLAFAAVVVWGVSALGGGSEGGSNGTGFAARILKIGGIGPDSLLARQDVIETAAVASVYQQTPYIVRGGGGQKVVALTFDDGPSEWTPQILAILRKEGVGATFFSVGGVISTFGANSVAAHQAGYPVGDHTWSHPQMPSFSLADQKLEIDRTSDALTGLGLPKPSLYRPPYGAYDQTTLALLKKRKMLLVLWDVDTLDWSRPGADVIVQNALSQVQSGSIILMHDGGGDRTQTLAALPRIIAGLRQRGYQMVTVPTLLVEDPPRPGETPPAAGAGA